MRDILRPLGQVDPEVYEAIQHEADRQNSRLELIASENFASDAIMEATGSVLTNKYAEGLPNKRYYGGCEFVDVIEDLARDRAKKLFGAEYVNVQPHSGAQANMAAYAAVMKPGERILGLGLAFGGHLTHGHPVNFSGMWYDSFTYGVRADDETIDYEQVEARANEYKPQVIMAGASAYPRTIDFQRFRKIADSVGAILVVDMAHIAGLVAARIHPSPVPYAHIVTSTTHKTLRGPRGGMILTNDAELAKRIDKAVFPGIQGGPLIHVIAGKAVCFKEAMEPQFARYQQQVVANAQALAEVLQACGYRIVSGGTDTHLILVDVFAKGRRGRDMEALLDRAWITVNKNTIPFDKNTPNNPSGIRLGTPAVTTRGMKEDEVRLIGAWVAEVMDGLDRPTTLEKVVLATQQRVAKLTEQFPLYS